MSRNPDQYPIPPPLLRIPSLDRNYSMAFEPQEPPKLIKMMSSQIIDEAIFDYDYRPPASLSKFPSQMFELPPPTLHNLRSRKSMVESQQVERQPSMQQKASQEIIKEEEQAHPSFKKYVTKNNSTQVQRIKKKIKSAQLEQQPCFCTKSGCLKRYCRCFHSGRMCFKECQCAEGCLNNDTHSEERQKAIVHVNEKCHRNKNVPKSALFKLKESFGCNCKNTRCQKGYCECFLRKQKCTIECQCDNCENGLDEAYMQSQQVRKNYRTWRRARNR